jgi:threonine dehydrogenase-like Zn-dependent dehydrogenase
MRAIRCSNGTASMVEVAPAEGEGVRVRVASAGICGSDLHLEAWNLPVTVGHEFAGWLSDGTPVAVEPMAPCGDCRNCRSGAYNLCRLVPSNLLGVARDGGMADECLVPSSSIVTLADGVSVRDACLVEPLAVAVHGVRRGRVSAGERVAVIGGGAIGQLAVPAAQAAGAAVDLEARHEHQSEVALALGAGSTSEGYDVVIEAAGIQSALVRAVSLCRPGGRLVLLGSYWDPVTMPGLQMSMSELDVLPSTMYARSAAARDVDVAAGILAARPELPGHLITHRFPLDGVREAFAVARDRASGAIKVVLEP